MMLDIVVAGPDMSGTSTQIGDIIKYFQGKGLKVRDIRGDEISALFHAKKFEKYNMKHMHYLDFRMDPEISMDDKYKFLWEAHNLIVGGGTNQDLQVASCVDNDVSTYIDPDSADVWILEEPTKRGSGQFNRVIEQNRSKYFSELDPINAAFSHAVYRVDEFLRFRKILREKGKIIVRSRSEESACYQIHHPELLSQGINRDLYLSLPGHKIAFGFPPTHIFIAHAHENWSREDYLKLKSERNKGRTTDDHEAKVDYQLLVNKRYATSWLDDFYAEACKLHNANTPKIIRMNLYDKQEEIQKQIHAKLDEIMKYQH